MDKTVEDDKDKIPSIHSYIDMKGLRQFLVYHPRLLLMFEILVQHIDDYIKHRIKRGKQSINHFTHLKIFKVIFRYSSVVSYKITNLTLARVAQLDSASDF